MIFIVYLFLNIPIHASSLDTVKSAYQAVADYKHKKKTIALTLTLASAGGFVYEKYLSIPINDFLWKWRAGKLPYDLNKIKEKEEAILNQKKIINDDHEFCDGERYKENDLTYLYVPFMGEKKISSVNKFDEKCQFFIFSKKNQCDRFEFPAADYVNKKENLSFFSSIELLSGVLNNTSLGQKIELNKLQTCLEFNNDKIKVLMGTCIGAATIINYLGSNQNINTIAAAILEVPFASAAYFFHGWTRSIFWWIPDFVLHLFIKLFIRNYAFSSQPINSIKTINKDIPLLLVCPRYDECGHFHAQKLYSAARKAGHKKIHILKLASHGHLSCRKNIKVCTHYNSERERYQNVIHAFYKTYGLPYIEEYAEAGMKSFKECQPW